MSNYSGKSWHYSGESRVADRDFLADLDPPIFKYAALNRVPLLLKLIKMIIIHDNYDIKQQFEFLVPQKHLLLKNYILKHFFRRITIFLVRYRSAK